MERKEFEVGGVKVLQQGMGTTPAVMGGHGGGETGARALVLRSRCEDKRQIRDVLTAGRNGVLTRSAVIRRK